MKAIAIIVGMLAGLNLVQAQGQSGPTVSRSGSGQFFVSVRSSISPQSLEFGSQPGMLTLEPPLLAVSCDRIKAELLREMSVPDTWQGKIFVVVRPARSANDPVFVVPQKLGHMWHCGVELPDAVDQNRLVEAIVRASLLEIANRGAGDSPTEIPEWLVRGLTRQVIGSSAIKVVLRPPLVTDKYGYKTTREIVDFSDSPKPSARPTRKLNPLAEAMDVLRTNKTLTFDQLSWPTDEQLSGNEAAVYDNCAQLFVSQLLRLKNGPECLQAMLAELPGHLNWQLAFDHAFQGIFPTPLDVEKWWALELTEFNGRDLLHLLTAAESSRQLDAVFEFPIEVQIGPGAPMRSEITLQTMVRGWSRQRQLEMLKSKIRELSILRMRISPDYMPLVDQYVQVLQEYYKKRSASTRLFATMGFVSDKSADTALAQLDLLDAERTRLREQSKAPVVSAAAEPAEPIVP